MLRNRSDISAAWPCWAIIACAGVLTACSPRHDWREVRDAGAQFVVALPAKPATLSRSINLDGLPLTMSMTAAEVDRVTFAVGSAQLPDSASTQDALSANCAGQ